MQMRVSERIKRIKPSIMMSVMALVKEMERKGIELVDLKGGEPELGTPAHIIEAAKRAMDEGHTTLTPSRGIYELREAVAWRLRQEFGLEVDPNREILISPGGKFAFFAAFASILEPGDEVLCLAPYFPPFREAVEIFDGKFVPVPVLHAGNQVELRTDELERRITKRTKVILLNYPHNPTGWAPTEQELEAVIHVALRHHLYIVTDEVYRYLIYEELPHRPIWTFPQIRQQAIQVDSFSKAYAMTGWRLGYCLAPKQLVDAMEQVQVNSTTCASSIAQWAGVTALLGPQDCVRRLVETYGSRRELMLRALNSMPGIVAIRPRGSLFVFVDISGLKLSSMEFAQRLLEEEKVVVTPGKAFGDEWDNYVRLSMTIDTSSIEVAMERMGNFARRISGSR